MHSIMGGSNKSTCVSSYNSPKVIHMRIFGAPGIGHDRPNNVRLSIELMFTGSTNIILFPPCNLQLYTAPMSFTRKAWAIDDDTRLHEKSTTLRYPVSDRKIGGTAEATIGAPSVGTARAENLRTDTAACVRTANMEAWHSERRGKKVLRTMTMQVLR